MGFLMKNGIEPGASLARALFAPRSVALIGLSNDPSRPAGRVLRYLRHGGFAGRVHVVNPRRDTVQGVPAVPTVAALPEVPEHAYVLLGTELAERAVADCAALGVPVVTVLADGFAEAGAEGRSRQARLVAAARAGGTRLLGPNSMGVADLHSGCWLTVNAVYDEPDQPRGRTALLSQSGSMMGGLISRARALGTGFSRVAAVGNEADLGIAEIGLACLDDPDTDVFALFLETIRDADGLARFAAAAQTRGKPVIALKLGRSSLGARMAVAHTGALLAEDAVADAYLREIGIARVTTLEGLLEAPALFRGRTPGAKRPTVGVVTTTGGGGAMVSDRLALEGVEIRPPSAATLAAVRGTGLSPAEGPVLDLTLAGAGPDYVRTALAALAADPGVDVIVSITGSSARAAPARTVPPLAEAARGNKPIAAFLTPDAPEALRALAEAGVPVFRTPESCADVVGAFCRWRSPRLRALARPPAAFAGRTLDEAASLALLARAGVPVVETIEVPVGEAPTLPFPFPVVAKALSDALPHKTEAGGVVTGIGGPEALVEAGRRIAGRVAARAGVAVDRLLVAPMVSALQEVLIGYRLDAQVGPVVTLAPGGVLVGLYDDKAVRLAPVDEATAREMIGEVKGLAGLRGHRGLPRGDLDALARAIAALSRLAAHQPAVLEAEANPVMVRARGVVAVDALVTLEEGEAR
jgi:acyl-CoA synthetase (NDP forming)